MKILFVSHDGSRTGAPMVLLHLLKFLKRNTEIEFEVLLCKDGILVSEFEKICKTYIYEIRKSNATNFIFRYLFNVYRYFRKNIFRYFFKKNKYHIVYINSIASCESIYELNFSKQIFKILHVHELEGVIKRYCNKPIFELMIPSIDHFIAVSGIVESNLVERYGINKSSISRIYEFIDENIIITETSSEIRKQLNIPDNAFVVGACGSIIWRKGIDLFIQLIERISRKNDFNGVIYFVWLGNTVDNNLFDQCFSDVKQLGACDFVKFPGEVKNPYNVYQIFDLFVLTSREDPFPLTAIENAYMGNPIICFDRGNGTKEFVDSSCGAIVPFLNVETIEEAVFKFYHDRELLKKASFIIRERSKKFLQLVQAKKILKLVEFFLKINKLS